MSEALLEIQDLEVRFPVRGQGGRRTVLRAVDGVSLSIPHGQTLGLVGESGCGKTSLVRAILGLGPAQAGAVWLDGQDLLTLSPRQRRTVSPRLQIVFQDPFGALDPSLSVHEIIAEPLRIHGRYDPARVTKLLDQVGLARDAEGRKAREFSGGQCQRIGIARALALDPDLLILDEPVSALDVSIQAQVMNLLIGLQQDLGLTYLFIAHDLSVVRHMSQSVAVMYLGRIVEQGPREAVFGRPAHPYTRSLLDAAPVARLSAVRGATRAMGDAPDPTNRPSGCAFRTRCPRARDRCAVDDPVLAPYGLGDQSAACWFPGPEGAP